MGRITSCRYKYLSRFTYFSIASTNDFHVKSTKTFIIVREICDYFGISTMLDYLRVCVILAFQIRLDLVLD